MPQKKKLSKKSAQPTGKSSTGSTVKLFIDDPISGVKAERVATPFKPAPARLRYKLHDAPTSPKTIKPGTLASAAAHVQFALSRGINYWASIAGSDLAGWQNGGVLDVYSDAGSDLNAYYDRQSLSFFHFEFPEHDRVLYSGESCDVVTHELGHAVLDALRPDLWDVMSVEAAAFHESFGDISALLIGLEDLGTRIMLLGKPGPSVYVNSRHSRIAESLGWGLRQMRPDSAAPDCLRNAVNAYFYRQPITLPPTGPDSSLTSEPHSFSRVFTGGVYEALSLMLLTHGKPTEDALQQTSRDFARLLIAALKLARNTPDFFSQVAGSLVAVASQAGDDNYAQAIRTAFVRRGILSLSTAAALQDPDSSWSMMGRTHPRGVAGPAGSAGVAVTHRLQAIDGETMGVQHRQVIVEAPEVDPRTGPRAAALTGGEAVPAEAASAAVQFATQLMRRGRIETPSSNAHAVFHPATRKTHTLHPDDANPRITRRFFDCGLDPFWG